MRSEKSSCHCWLQNNTTLGQLFWPIPRISNCKKKPCREITTTCSFSAVRPNVKLQAGNLAALHCCRVAATAARRNRLYALQNNYYFPFASPGKYDNKWKLRSVIYKAKKNELVCFCRMLMFSLRWCFYVFHLAKLHCSATTSSVIVFVSHLDSKHATYFQQSCLKVCMEI